MAPELYSTGGEKKSDVWSLGLSLMVLAEGKHPYENCNNYQVSAGFPLIMLDNEKGV